MNHDNTAHTLTVTIGATLVTWLPLLDTWLRMAASLVAIISGIVCTVIAVRRRNRAS